MPTTASKAKVAGAERLGARVVFEGTTTSERMARAKEIVAQEQATLVPPYDDPRIIAGQGTAGLEIAEDLAALGVDEYAVLVQVGGGGLSAGVSAAVKQAAPRSRVVVVEPTASPKLSAARAAGEPTTIPSNPDGITDGLLSIRIGALTFDHLQAHADDVVQVADSAVPPAMRFLLDRHKLVAEPSGAITVAALMSGVANWSVGSNGSRQPVVCFLSGGNIEWDGLGAVFGSVRA
jgi:threonine dehydratase